MHSELLLLKANAATSQESNIGDQLQEQPQQQQQHWIQLKRLRRQISQEQGSNSSSINRSRQQDTLIKPLRERWPTSDDTRPTANSHHKGNVSRTERINNNEQEKQAQKVKVQIHRNQRVDPRNSPALIHTDKVNTSSPLLYVYGPKNGRLNSRLHSQQQQQDHSAAESSISPSRVAILAATGPSASTLATLKGATSPQVAADQLVPRLVVLDLQVGSSTVTLAWSLTLQPAEEPTANTDPDRLDIKTNGEFTHNTTTNSSAITSTSSTSTTTTSTSTTTTKPPQQKLIDNKELLSDQLFETEETATSATTALNRTTNNDVGSKIRARRATIRVEPATSTLDQTVALLTQEANQQAQVNSTSIPKSLSDSRLDSKQHNDSLILADPKRISTATLITQLDSRKVSNESIIEPLKPTQNLTTRGSLGSRIKLSPMKVLSTSHEENRLTQTNNTKVRELTQTDSLHSNSRNGVEIVSYNRRRADMNNSSSVQNSSDEPPMIKTPAITLNRISTNFMRHHKSNRTAKSFANASQIEVPSGTNTKSLSGVSLVSSSTTTTTPLQSQSRRSVDEEPSRWLVRLRRFGSNEVDIVQVVVSDLRRALEMKKPLARERFIAFKGLEPSSGYELCVESASPNQQVGDKYQILDSNHYLKCHDTSDLELSSPDSSSTSTTSRSDLKQRTASDNDSSSSSSSSFSSPSARRVKSLCKEFFTLPHNATEPATFSGLHTKPLQRAEGSNSSDTVSSSTISRRPKSLNGALKSRMEVLEISELSSSASGDKSMSTFEMLIAGGESPAVRSLSQQQLVPAQTIQEDSRLIHTLSAAIQPNKPIDRILIEHQSTGGVPGLIQNGAQDYMSLSLLPIVGCVFALIFMVTLANILLSAINCGTSNSRSASRVARQRNSRMTRSPVYPPSPNQMGGTQHQQQYGAGSFYSDQSDLSSTSQSRMVVGKDSRAEPFANSAAFFELPAASVRNSHRTDGSLSTMKLGGSSSPLGSGSNYLLNASAARFPLGPSFEGDERHNADMVGLARKNYDNFIHSIYNSSTQSPEFLPNISNHHSSGHLSTSVGSGHTHCHNRHSNSDQSREAHPQSIDQPAGKGRENSSKHQRLRFDKINPIYNMDGLLQYSNCSIPRKSRLRSPLSITSFGHSNQALSFNESDEQERQMNESNEQANDSQENCPICSHSVQLDNQNPPPPPPLNEEDVGVQVDEQGGDEYPYTCCLDRQKQRFERQQQQLERVLTRNGSLLPQPFINPTGPTRCASPNCQAALEEREAAIKLADDGSLISQLDKAELELVEHEKSPTGGKRQELKQTESSNSPTSNEQKNFLMFGDSSSSSSTYSCSNQKRDLPAPPPPAPAPVDQPTLSDSPATPTGKSGAIKLNHQASHKEAIKKTDFNQRRIELASKLHLAGMTKPSP